MAAILGIDDSIIENVCSNIEKIIQPANYNCPGQLVISGEIDAVKIACKELTNLGAKRAIILPVSGAFHSELMNSAAEELEHSINQTEFNNPVCPIYQNYNAKPETNKESIKRNLLLQLTNPVLWSQSVNRMIKDGFKNFFELGPGNTLQGLIRKIDSQVNTEKLEI
jgi:[acyl-carrier-protein] S-malonyltransferase